MWKLELQCQKTGHIFKRIGIIRARKSVHLVTSNKKNLKEVLITVNFLAVFFLEVRILNLGFINMRVDYSC